MNTADYNNSIFKQLEEVMFECKKLRNDLDETKLHHRIEVIKLEKEVDYLKSENKALQEDNKILKENIKILKEENDKLKGIVSKDSTNSSIPPSQDNKKKQVNLREKSNKKQGGQKNHKGTTLKQEDIEKLIEENKATKKIIVHGNKNNPVCIKKSIVDIETRVIVTEHLFYFKNKSEIKIPKEYKSNVQYGENLKTLCNILVAEDTVSLERTSELVRILTEGTITISQGSIVNWLIEKSKKCEEAVRKIEEKLKSGKIIFTDATTTSLNGKYGYVRNYSNSEYTLYKASEDKKIETIKEQAVLNNYTGIIMHDHETSLYNFGLHQNHAECNVNLRRYLKYNLENNPQNTWAKELDKFLLEIKQEKEKIIGAGKNEFTKEYVSTINKKYDEIIKIGYEENKKKPSKYLHREEKALLNRLVKYKKEQLLFAYNFEVPFDNNLSERDLRKIKTKKKVSGCFRSKRLFEAYCKIQSVISTCKKQSLNIFEILKNIAPNKVSF